MTPRVFRACSRVDVPPGDLFAWHERAGALDRLIPPWVRAEVNERSDGLRDGQRVVLRVRLGPVSRRWVAVLRDCVEPRQFRDEQVEGPFAHWVHTHRFEALEAGGSALEDHVEYRLPGGALGRLADGAVRAHLRRLFTYRHAVTRADLERHRDVGGGASLRVAVTGATGLVGSTLVPFLTAGGHRVQRLVRHPSGPSGDIPWDPARGLLEAGALEGLDAVVHLAGESIAAGRWTDARKRAIRDSRIEGTRLLAGTLAGLARPPRVLVAASATGFYGDRGEEELDEQSAPGQGFLADVCRQWEGASAPARERGIRVVLLRTGLVLTPSGGALASLLRPFRLGAGGPIGRGRQFMSSIALDDLIGAIHFALGTEGLEGPVNAVGPHPVTNREFVRTLGRVLRRPALVPLPAPAVRLLLGEMGDALLLASARVVPRVLERAGFRFRHPRLEDALRFQLGLRAPAEGIAFT